MVHNFRSVCICVSCLRKAQSTPPSATTGLAPSAAAVTPTGPPANSRKRRLRLSPALNGNDRSAGTAVVVEDANGAIGAENETAT